MSVCAKLVIATVALLPSAVFAAPRDAARHVREGIASYRAGKFDAAAKSFDQADVSLPEDPTIAFNRACAYAASKDADKAIELFGKAALARDDKIVSASQYNLGCIAAAKGKAIFGESAEDATPQVRAEGMSQINRAIGHYRDCLQVEENHKAARRNLELLQLWKKHMQDVWAKRDREKQREEMNLLQFLEMIQAKQTAIRTATRVVTKQDDSPRKRQAISELENQQRDLSDEIDPLKEKITETLTPQPDPNAQQPTPMPDSAEVEKAIERLHKSADSAKRRMQEAASDLDDREVSDAPQHQAASLDSLNEIFTTIAPFSNVLSKATQWQERLVSQSKAIVEHDSSDSSSDDDPPEADFEEASRDQERVSLWSEVLPLKAEHEMQQLNSAPMTDPMPQGTDNEQAEQQRQAMKQAYEKAIELCPRIVELADEAVEALDEQDTPKALPKQEEALKLLKEIAEQLPKQDQDQNQDKQDENQGDRKQNDQQQNQQPRDRPSQQDLTREQAEQMIRRARERERQHRQMQKQMRAAGHGRAMVDRDW